MSATFAAPARISPAEQTVLDALREADFVEHECWHYPANVALSLVRISVFGGQYQLWRRRTVKSEWMIVVAADCEDFDPQAFRSWYTSPRRLLAA